MAFGSMEQGQRIFHRLHQGQNGRRSYSSKVLDSGWKVEWVEWVSLGLYYGTCSLGTNVW